MYYFTTILGIDGLSGLTSIRPFSMIFQICWTSGIKFEISNLKFQIKEGLIYAIDFS